jgi:hypothetical protein
MVLLGWDISFLKKISPPHLPTLFIAWRLTFFCFLTCCAEKKNFLEGYLLTLLSKKEVLNSSQRLKLENKQNHHPPFLLP